MGQQLVGAWRTVCSAAGSSTPTTPSRAGCPSTSNYAGASARSRHRPEPAERERRHQDQRRPPRRGNVLRRDADRRARQPVQQAGGRHVRQHGAQFADAGRATAAPTRRSSSTSASAATAISKSASRRSTCSTTSTSATRTAASARLPTRAPTPASSTRRRSGTPIRSGNSSSASSSASSRHAVTIRRAGSEKGPALLFCVGERARGQGEGETGKRGKGNAALECVPRRCVFAVGADGGCRANG